MPPRPRPLHFAANPQQEKEMECILDADVGHVNSKFHDEDIVNDSSDSESPPVLFDSSDSDQPAQYGCHGHDPDDSDDDCDVMSDDTHKHEADRNHVWDSWFELN